MKNLLFQQGENTMFKFVLEKTTKQSNGKSSFTLLQKLGNDFTNGNYVLHLNEYPVVNFDCSLICSQKTVCTQFIVSFIKYYCRFL